MAKKPNILPLVLLAAGVGGYAIYHRQKAAEKEAFTINEPDAEIKALILAIWKYTDASSDSAADNERFKTLVTSMEDQEIRDVYALLFDYEAKGIIVPNGSPLQTRLKAISARYNIFT